MRAIILAIAAGLGVVGLPGCVPGDAYNTVAYTRPSPTTTTTTTTVVVRDGYGNPISTTEAVRDANGNPVASTSAGTYQYVPGHYQNVPGYAAEPYQRQ